VHLGINGWPPVASHMACLVLGLALAHLARGAGQPVARLPKRGIVIGVPAPAGDPGAKGVVRVHLAERTALGPTCRVTASPVERLPSSAWTFALPLAETDSVPKLVRTLKDGAVILVEESAGKLLPVCNHGPKVTYGAP
jgi:hypothetical protein